MGREFFKHKEEDERNSLIIERADELIAFQVDHSSGTQDTIDKAREREIKVEVIEYNSSMTNEAYSPQNILRRIALEESVGREMAEWLLGETLEENIPIIFGDSVEKAISLREFIARGKPFLAHTFNSEDPFESILESFGSILNIPGKVNISAIKDRITGREDEYVLVVVGLKYLNKKDKKRFNHIVKILKIPDERQLFL